MGEASERRKVPRVSRREKLFIRIASSADHPELVGTTVRGTTDDLSSEGLRIRLGHPVERGCTLELWVKLSDQPGSFLLTGQVMWQSPEADAEGLHVTGLRLLDGFGEDQGAWRLRTGSDPGEAT